jgi:hypothetical protein
MELYKAESSYPTKVVRKPYGTFVVHLNRFGTRRQLVKLWLLSWVYTAKYKLGL